MKTNDFFGTTRRTAEPFAVPLGGGDNFCNGFIKNRIVLATSETEREGEVTDADKEDIDYVSRGDFFNLLDTSCLFDDPDHKNIGVGRVVVVAEDRPGGHGRSCARTAATERGIVASLHRDAGAFYCRDEREDNTLHALVEYTLRQPELGPWDTCKDRYAQSARGKQKRAK